MADLLVYGSLEFGRVVKDLAVQCGHRFAGFVDDFNRGEEVLGTFDEVAGRCPPPRYEVAIAVGYRNLGARWDVYRKVKARGYQLPPLVHPRAYVRDPARIGEGTFVMAGAIVDVHATLGALVVAWPGVVVNHDSTVGENTFLSPNATVCGCVTVGRQAFVGAGATIVDHVEVPAEAFIKAGSLYREPHDPSPEAPGP
jgi:sugar O-acyltransferase (sialic acid O-acetyltransferase NeuD family)